MLKKPVIHLDRSGTASFIGWAGEVNTFADLPLASEHLGEFYMVLNATGSRLLFTYKASGLYRAEGGVWVKKNDVQLLLNDDQFTVYNSADNSKTLSFDLSTITTATNRTVIFQDKNGTVALLDDITIDTLQTVTDNGNTTTNDIEVAALLADSLQVKGGVGTQGLMTWDSNEETVQLVMNGTIGHLNHDVFYHVRNNTASIIPINTPVYASGTLGSSGRITIAPMIADNSIESKFFIGVTVEEIGVNANGKVAKFSRVNDLDTSSWVDGQVLYVSETTAGGWTTTQPQAPNLKLAAAIVIYSHPTQGIIQVRATQGSDLGNDHLVELVGLANGDVLKWSALNGRFENQPIVEPNVRNNFVLVQNKSDLPAPVGGVITLADNTDYEINGFINIGTDRIVMGLNNKIYGITALKDRIISATTSGALFTSTNNSVVFNNISFISSGVGSEIFNLTGDGTNKGLLDKCICIGSTSIGTITGGFDTLIIDGCVFSGNSGGLEIQGTSNDVYIFDNFIEGFTGTPTALSFSGSGTYHTINISRNMFEVDTGQTALNISNTLTVTDGGIIIANTFEGVGFYLTGITPNTTDWLIPYKTNVGLAGLLEQFLNWGIDGAFGTTSTTNLSPILTTDSLANYGEGITTINCILEASVTHQQSGNTVRIEINDVTNGNVAVAGSAVDFVVTNANQYYVVNTPEVTLNPQHEYNVKVTRVTGSGQNLAGSRSAVWKLKIF